MSADTERHPMDSWNVIAHTDPISDEEADRLVAQLATWSPVVDGDGTIVLTLKISDDQNYALWSGSTILANALGSGINLTSVEVMTTATYDELYLHAEDAQGDRQYAEGSPS